MKVRNILVYLGNLVFSFAAHNALTDDLKFFQNSKDRKAIVLEKKKMMKVRDTLVYLGNLSLEFSEGLHLYVFLHL